MKILQTLNPNLERGLIEKDECHPQLVKKKKK